MKRPLPAGNLGGSTKEDRPRRTEKAQKATIQKVFDGPVRAILQQWTSSGLLKEVTFFFFQCALSFLNECIKVHTFYLLPIILF